MEQLCKTNCHLPNRKKPYQEPNIHLTFLETEPQCKGGAGGEGGKSNLKRHLKPKQVHATKSQLDAAYSVAIPTPLQLGNIGFFTAVCTFVL